MKFTNEKTFLKRQQDSGLPGKIKDNAKAWDKYMEKGWGDRQDKTLKGRQREKPTIYAHEGN